MSTESVDLAALAWAQVEAARMEFDAACALLEARIASAESLREYAPESERARLTQTIDGWRCVLADGRARVSEMIV